MTVSPPGGTPLRLHAHHPAQGSATGGGASRVMPIC
jgi:hypothetical protein